ncbi:MAG TPA: rod shape-determining protein MreC [Gaiellaceae bacterium]|nr:rod shape-determining protein MreC [Gaiellaceae bacterium]
MPRNRNVRVAVLGSSVQRAAASGHSSTRSSQLRRRFVVVGLVMVSLALVTVSFRSAALDPVEGFSASVLRPFEIAANRVARPFRDAANWTHGLFDAKAQNKRLVAEIAVLRRKNAALTGAETENADLHKQLHYVHSPSYPKDYNEVGARVLSSPSTLDQSVTISAGSNQGIEPEDVVVTNDGLVGTVSKVFGSESRVTLITDPTSAVRAVDEKNLAAVGLLDHGTGANSLVLDGIGKDKVVGSGDTIITAGSQQDSKLLSIFPRNIPIGYVSGVGRSDTDIYTEIQVQPFVDFSSLESVLVLIPIPKPTHPAHRSARKT